MDRSQKIKALSDRVKPVVEVKGQEFLTDLESRLAVFDDKLEEGIKISNLQEFSDQLSKFHTIINSIKVPELKTEPSAIRAKTIGDTTYIASAVAGTKLTDSNWKVIKIDESNGLSVTFADGNSNYDNKATALERLSYS